MKHIHTFESFLNEGSGSLNEAKKVIVVTRGGKEYEFNNNDIQDMINDFDVSAENLPSWMYKAGLKGVKGFPKKPNAVLVYLESILKHNGNVRINVEDDKPYRNNIKFE